MANIPQQKQQPLWICAKVLPSTVNLHPPRLLHCNHYHLSAARFCWGFILTLRTVSLHTFIHYTYCEHCIGPPWALCLWTHWQKRSWELHGSGGIVHCMLCVCVTACGLCLLPCIGSLSVSAWVRCVIAWSLALIGFSPQRDCLQGLVLPTT